MLSRCYKSPSAQRFRAAVRLGGLGLVALHLPLLIAALLLAFTASNTAGAADLTINVAPFEGRTGNVLLYVFHESSAADFPVDFSKAVCEQQAVVAAEQMDLVCTDLPQGVYAGVAMHDVNGNGYLDHSWLRLPAEPLGFSSGCRPIAGPPRFKRCQFEFGEDDARIGIRLR